MNLRNEHPTPQFQRRNWMNLNGKWDFEFDDHQVGKKEKWYIKEKKFTQTIQVPFVYQSELSGVNSQEIHDVVWYKKKINLPDTFTNKRVILHFGAVDYQADVWVNGFHIGYHEGGHTPFQMDITDALIKEDINFVVRAEDFSTDKTLPRGKQYWRTDPEEIWYTNTTGIWQTVWLEAVEPIHIERLKFTPYIDTTEIQIQSFITDYDPKQDIDLKINIIFDGEVFVEDTYKVKNNVETRRIRLHEFNEHHMSHLWTPETPYLYDVEITLLCNNQIIDEVYSYFGMRKIEVYGNKVLLNNKPYYMKLVLDQGYFPKSLLTPSSDEAVKKDIELTKAMGFNGVRKHQKVEDPRFLYWCDKMGLLVWGEMANALDFSEKYAKRIVNEWQEVIERDFNHPCIIVWVPMNESWGIPKVKDDLQQQNHALALYHLTKSLDPTRLVVSNDGWEQLKTDLCTIHDYASHSDLLQERYSNVDNACCSIPWAKSIYVGDFKYTGEPIIISEFGGIALKKSAHEGWGYSGAKDEEDFIKKLKNVVEPLQQSPIVQGFCYTQLTDVMQEINGLLTDQRIPKIPIDMIKSIIDK